MKLFLYLDTDTVNSIIAQSEQGLILSSSNELESSNTESNDSKKVTNTTGKILGGIAKLANIEASLIKSVEKSKGNSSTSTSTFHEIISKTMHDAAFDIACTYINLKNIPNDSPHKCIIGDYIEINRIFDFIDFDYLETLINDSMFENSIVENEAKKAKEQGNREQRRNSARNSNSKGQNSITESKKQYKSIKETIKTLRNLIPYKQMLISNDGFLIPFNPKYFRVDSNDLGFKYGGKITCIGIITNIINENNPNINHNPFSFLQSSINDLMRRILPIHQNDVYVIHPIAIYYEDNGQTDQDFF